MSLYGSAWLFWLAVAAVVVLIAAGLLIWIWWLTRAIAGNAVRALRAAEQIRANTNSIWLLDDVNKVGVKLLHRVASIHENARTVADVLANGGDADGDAEAAEPSPSAALSQKEE